MIPNNVKRGEVTNNLGATRSKRLGIDPRNIQFIMDLLTNMYSDEEMACIREYSTNALDAQRVAGYTGPILVSTPTELAPFLKIKDHGTGMSSDELLDMYTEYTTSTKREDAEANGFMGIGSKSALAYGDQFTIISVKDRMKTIASISRGDDGSASMDIISEDVTDEPNGTEIIIPTKRDHNFDHKAQNLFKFWAPGTVLINGKEPDRSELEKMTDRIYFHDGNQDLIVMGNVPYPLDYQYSIVENGRRIAAYVTMNGSDEVVIHPSRERLIYNPITTNVIAGIKEEFEAKIHDFIESEVSAAPNFVEAYRLVSRFRNDYGTRFVKDLMFDGFDLNDDRIYSDPTNKTVATYLNWNPGRTRNQVNGGNYLTMGSLNGAVAIVVGFPNSSTVSSAYKTRLKEYFRANGIDFTGYWTSVVLFSGDTLPEPKKTDGFKVFSWKEIMKATKAPYTGGSGGGFSYGGRYDVLDTTTGCWNVEAVDSNAEIYFFSEAEHTLDLPFALKIKKKRPDAVFIKASTNRHGKLQREYPNAKPFEPLPWMDIFAKDEFDSLTDDDFAILRAKHVYRDRPWYDGDRKNFGLSDIPARLAPEIADPEFREAATLYKSTGPVLEYARRDKRWGDLVSQWDKERKTASEFPKKYPLMKWSAFPKETLEYVNAIYNSKEQ